MAPDPDAHHRDSNVRPAVGVGVMIVRSDRILLGKRKGAHGEGTFGWPGGGLAFGESLHAAVHREVLEETGLAVRNPRLICVSNVVDYGRHYLDVEFQVDCPLGEPDLRVPRYVESWSWYQLDDLPSPMFRPCELAIRSLKDGNFLND